MWVPIICLIILAGCMAALAWICWATAPELETKDQWEDKQW